MLVEDWVTWTHCRANLRVCGASCEGPEVPGTRHRRGTLRQPREERSLLVKCGHCEAAAWAPLRILGPRVTAKAAEDAGDGQGDQKQ